jgi:hypothetical protein
MVSHVRAMWEVHLKLMRQSEQHWMDRAPLDLGMIND